MSLSIYNSLSPNFGNKRRLCSDVFHFTAMFLPQQSWLGKVFVDASWGSGAMSLFAKKQGFRAVANDIAERSIMDLLEQGRAIRQPS